MRVDEGKVVYRKPVVARRHGRLRGRSGHQQPTISAETSKMPRNGHSSQLIEQDSTSRDRRRKLARGTWRLEVPNPTGLAVVVMRIDHVDCRALVVIIEMCSGNIHNIEPLHHFTAQLLGDQNFR
jgi:hypothetical protein